MKSPLLITLLVMMIVLSNSVFAFTTIGLSRVDFSSNDAQLAGPAWLLSVVENGNSEYAEGIIDNTQVTATVNGTQAVAKNDIKIAISNSQNTCSYSFANSGTDIYTLNLQSVSFLSAESICKSTTGCFMWWRDGFSGYNVIRTSSGKITPLSTPTTQIVSTISATVGGETVSGTVTNTKDTSVVLGTRARAQWVGNLVSGSSCPDALSEGVTGVLANGQYFITNQAAQQSYDPYQNDFTTCINNERSNTIYLGSETVYKQCVASYNTKSSRLMTKTTIAPFNNAVISSGTATFKTAGLLQYPMITLKVKADWLGIVVPVGQPRITSATTKEFNTGDNGNIAVTVQNIGQATGSFDVYAVCDGNTIQEGTTRRISNLAAGDSASVDIGLLCSYIAQQTKSNCVIEAKDVNSPTNKDSKTVTSVCNPVAICTANQKRCDTNQIQFCKADGSAWTTQETCLNGCTVINGVPACVNAESCSQNSDCDDKDSTTIDECVGIVSKQCKHTPTDNSFNSTIFFITLAIALIGGIVTYSTTSSLTNVSKKYGTWARIVLAIIVLMVLFFAVPAFLKWIANLFSFSLW